MLGTDLDFKLAGTRYCARAQCVSHGTPTTPWVMVNVTKQRLGSPHDMPFLGNAAVAPGTSTPKSADVNIFHCTYNLAHIDLRKATAKQLGNTLIGSLKPCNACAPSNGIRKPTTFSTSTRSDKKLGIVHLDVSGPEQVAVRGKSYIMLVRDYFNRESWIYSLASVSEACISLEYFVPDVAREENVEIIRSDNQGSVKGCSLKHVGTIRFFKTFHL